MPLRGDAKEGREGKGGQQSEPRVGSQPGRLSLQDPRHHEPAHSVRQRGERRAGASGLQGSDWSGTVRLREEREAGFGRRRTEESSPFPLPAAGLRTALGE